MQCVANKSHSCNNPPYYFLTCQLQKALAMPICVLKLLILVTRPMRGMRSWYNGQPTMLLYISSLGSDFALQSFKSDNRKEPISQRSREYVFAIFIKFHSFLYNVLCATWTGRSSRNPQPVGQEKSPTGVTANFL